MALNRLFIANRGEIAVRILRTAKRLGLETVIGVSEADRESMGAEMADRAVVLGPAPSAKSYLDERLIVHAARMTGCDALHPCYGFLSEKAKLASLCEEEGIVFVGPRPETIDMLGDKLSARTMALQAGVQTVPGTDHVATIADARHAAEQLGYPVVMKASAGGGGRGMFMARSATAGCTWSVLSNVRAMSRFRSWGTARVRSFISASATAPCDGAIRN